MNMSSSTDNISTPTTQEFNLAPIPSPITILDVENTHMNMSCSTENTLSPIIEEFNHASVPSPSTIPDVENTHMNMSCSTENTPTPIIEEFNHASVPSSSAIPVLENTHMNTSSSKENSQTPIIEDFNPTPVPSRTTIPDSVNLKRNLDKHPENSRTPGFEGMPTESAASPTPPKQDSSRTGEDIDRSPKTSQPSVLESFGPQNVPAHLPGSANSEKEIDNSSENSHLPGWETFIPETIPPSPPHIPGNSTCSSPQTSAPPGWEHTSPQPSPLEGNHSIEFSGNTENVDISPNNSHPPPGWDDIACGSAAPTPAIPGSSSIEKQKDMGSSPEISQPPGWEKFHEQHIPAPLPGMSQVVCGSCRQLLSYPQGITHVKCPCCHTVNFVLEEHQVGTVKCAKCWVWLMYPHGAPSVRCSACQFVTQIGEDNVRPPLSVQQNRSFVSPSSVQ